MLTNKQIKLINSLHSKKGRLDNQLFLVEGEKAVLELLDTNFNIEFIVISDLFATHLKSKLCYTEFYAVDEAQINKLSTLVNNSFGFAVVSMKQFVFQLAYDNQITVVLDGIRDPGNLGTIIRICDWYGIEQILLSHDCTDLFNPKVIAASMGSYARIKFQYHDLQDIFKLEKDIPVLGALLEGNDLHQIEFPKACFLLFGNESIGIRKENLHFVTTRVTIPRYGMAESLNVGVSTAIFLDNIKRRQSSLLR